MGCRRSSAPRMSVWKPVLSFDWRFHDFTTSCHCRHRSPVLALPCGCTYMYIACIPLRVPCPRGRHLSVTCITCLFPALSLPQNWYLICRRNSFSQPCISLRPLAV
jgi:hypothetical protein